MPSYTFNCPQCGTFSEWHQSNKGDKQMSQCPSCEMDAKRVFAPPIVYKVDQRVKDIEAAGREPRTMKKQDMPKKKRNYVRSRPWQA